MLFLKSWLEDYIDLSKFDDQQLADLISIRSSEVESVRKIKDRFEGLVIVGKITNIKNHPESDYLRYFDVEIGENKKVSIVSAAKNVADGLLVPLALPGANYGGFIVGSKKMKGIESNGVCLGKSELNLETKYSEGLWELNKILNEKAIGQSVCEALPDYFSSDTVFDIKILPDKISKIGNHLGMAIEIAVILNDLSLLKSYAKSITNQEGLNQLISKISKIKVVENEQQCLIKDEYNYINSFALFDIELQNSFELDCKKRYRMLSLEENLNSLIVDLSNYIQLDIGQPSHFFKTTSLNASLMEIARLEKPTSFDGLGKLKAIQLPKGISVLKCENEILSIPGISGSLSTAVDKECLKMTLELANFKDFAVANNSFLMNYRSPAAKLYCSEIDPFMVLIGLLKFIDEFEGVIIKTHSLFVENKNTTFSKWIDEIVKTIHNSINFDLNYINSRITKLDLKEEIQTILPMFGFLNGCKITPFPLVSLLSTTEDLVREVSRIIGYTSLQNEYLLSNTSRMANNHYFNLIRIKECVTGYGFFEIATRPFIHDKNLALLSNDKKFLKLYNPYREGVETMRSDLNISILESLSTNLLDGYKDTKVFELSRAYHQVETQLIESIILGCGMIGDDFNLVTTMINEILLRLNIQEYSNNQSTITYGNSTSYNAGGIEIANIIEVSNKVKKQFNLPLNKTIVICTFNLPDNIEEFNNYQGYNDESVYPTIRRSYNLTIEKKRNTKSIINEILAIESDYKVIINPIERIEINHSNDKLLLDIKYTSQNRTLTTNDITKIEELLNNYV
jgi:phenylalanyl-tRNA synthetase beta chain